MKSLREGLSARSSVRLSWVYSCYFRPTKYLQLKESWKASIFGMLLLTRLLGSALLVNQMLRAKLSTVVCSSTLRRAVHCRSFKAEDAIVYR